MTLEIQTAELSPANQIMIAVTHVYQAHDGDPPARAVAAAVISAAADQVVPDVDLHVSVAAELLPKDIGAAKWSARHEARRHLLAIADELGGQPFNQADFNYQCYVEDYK